MLDLLAGLAKVNLVVPVDQVDQVGQEVQDRIQELAWPLVVLDLTITNSIKCEKFIKTFGRYLHVIIDIMKQLSLIFEFWRPNCAQNENFIQFCC